MQVLTIVQTKGGSGKTTLAMTVASAALARGERVHMFDADVNHQLMGWREAYEAANWGHVAKPAWPETLTMSIPPADVGELYQALERLEADAYDLVIIDTRPGTYSDTEDLTLAADVVMIPAKPAQAEWRLVHSAFAWMADLQDAVKEGEPFPVVKAAVCNAPLAIMKVAGGISEPSSLPRHDYQVLEEVLAMPHFDTILPTSKIFEHFLHHGPLGVAEAGHREAKNHLMARNFRDLLEAADALYEEVKGATA